MRAVDIAEYLISKAKEDGIEDLTRSKLNSILYLIYGYHLALTGEKMFDEDVLGWERKW